MYAIYRELHPPTGVEHCLECNFFGPKRKSLAVAAASVLKVYDLCPVKSGADKDGEASVTSKLLQVADYSLYGCVQSMEKVRLLHSKRDTLLLSFNDAKLSAVEFDPETNRLKTMSLHCFEDEDLRGGLLHNPSVSVVRVDPEGRCAAMLLYGAHLAILPFKHADVGLDEHDPDTPLIASEHHDIQASYTVSLRDLSERVSSVKDIQFLHGYNNPTLFILYEPTPTWAGRISLRKDTCNIVAISLNTSEKTSPVIWHSHSLPYDCTYALPVPPPIGGMLLLGANSILYLNQSSPTLGISLNSVSDVSTNFPLRNPAGSVAITMDCSHSAFIAPEQLVVSLKGGEIYLLTLVPDGMRGIRNILFEKAAAAVLTSCICTLGSQYIFLGSRLGNSLLLKYTVKASRGAEDLEPPAKKAKTESVSGAEDLEPPAKKAKTESVSVGEDPDELEVYGTDTTTGPMLTSYKFEVCDSLLNIGPIADATIGNPDFISEEVSQCVCLYISICVHLLLT
jgi:cleavage and polyadenylation specificity factor subunit 1